MSGPSGVLLQGRQQYQQCPGAGVTAQPGASNRKPVGTSILVPKQLPPSSHKADTQVLAQTCPSGLFFVCKERGEGSPRTTGYFICASQKGVVWAMPAGVEEVLRPLS